MSERTETDWEGIERDYEESIKPENLSESGCCALWIGQIWEPKDRSKMSDYREIESIENGCVKYVTERGWDEAKDWPRIIKRSCSLKAFRAWISKRGATLSKLSSHNAELRNRANLKP